MFNEPFAVTQPVYDHYEVMNAILGTDRGSNR